MTFEQIKVLYDDLFSFRAELVEADITYRYSLEDDHQRFQVSLITKWGQNEGTHSLGAGDTVEEAVKDALDGLTCYFDRRDEMEIKAALKALKCL
jgi:hypothetical protein